MNPEDARKAKRIEALLISNHVNVAKLDVEVIGDSVYIGGEFQLFEYDFGGKRLTDPTQRAAAVKKACQIIQQEVRRMFGIYHIQWQLTNWESVGTQWMPKGNTTLIRSLLPSALSLAR